MIAATSHTLESLLIRAALEMMAQASADDLPCVLTPRTLACHLGLTGSSLTKAMGLVRLVEGDQRKGLALWMVSRQARGCERSILVGDETKRADARSAPQADVWRALVRSGSQPERFDAFCAGLDKGIAVVRREKVSRAPIVVRCQVPVEALQIHEGPDGAQIEAGPVDGKERLVVPIPPERFVAVDVETTADRDPRITEVGFVFFEAGEIVGQWESLVFPDRALSWRATQITGLRDSDLEDAPRFDDLAEKVWHSLSGKTVVAHNLKGTDKPRLRDELERAGLEWPEVKEVDTLPMAKRLLGRKNRVKLGDVAREFGIDHRENHRALGDAETAGRVYLALQKRDKQGALI